jgi:ribosomal protein S12 methylthiotransferase accessory factor
MKLRPTISAQELFNLEARRGLFGRLARLSQKVLEKYFGRDIFFEVPENLKKIDPTLWRVIAEAEKLQSLGIINGIKKISRHSDEPFLYKYLAESARTYGGNADTLRAYWGGADFLSEKRSLWKVIGESVERYPWYYHDFFSSDLLRTSLRDITRKNKYAITLPLAGFSDYQRKTFSVLSFDRNTIFGWSKAESLVRNQTILCPTQLLSAHYFNQNVSTPKYPQKNEPMLRWAVTTGLAAGTSMTAAILGGILEIIERDAFMITYLNKLSPPKIDLAYLASDDDVNKILKSFERYNLEVHLLRLPTDFDIFVSLAIIIDRSGLGPALNVGMSADFDSKTSILDSLAECLSVRLALKGRWQRDIDMNDINREERVIYWSKPENLSKLDFLFQGETIRVDLARGRNIFLVPKENKQGLDEINDRKLKKLIDSFKKLGYELIYRDITSLEIKKLGYYCACVVSPDMQPLHLSESIPYFGGKRLQEVPKKFGYQAAEVLNDEPHPFP